ncbi:MAG: sialidase family protein [candidate division WOR-3 bacterium]
MRFHVLVLAIWLLALPALGAWEPPVRLTYDDSASHTSFNNVHCLAGSGSTLHLVWYDHRTGTDQVFYKRSTDLGTTWSGDTALTSGAGAKVDPSLAVAGDYVHLVWEDSRNGYNSEVYYRRSTNNGLTWESEQRLTNDNYMSRNPCVAVSGSCVYVAWSSDTAGREIYFQRSTDNGATWVDRRRLTFDMQESWYPSLAVAGNVVHLAWRDWRDHSFEVYYLRSTDAGATWDTAALRLSGDVITGSYNPCIAASGPATHVVWWDCRHTPFELYYRRSSDYGSTWEPEVRLTTDTTGTYNPSIAAHNPGVHVVWEALYGTSYAMYKHSTDMGETWSVDTALTTTPAYWSVAPCVAVLGVGVHVVWTDFRDSEYGEIYYMRDTTANATALTEVASRPSRAAGRTTIVRGVLRLDAGNVTQSGASDAPGPSRAVLLDAIGRTVMELRTGTNDVRRPAPGVYFVRYAEDQAVRKLLIVR